MRFRGFLNHFIRKNGQPVVSQTVDTGAQTQGVEIDPKQPPVVIPQDQMTYREHNGAVHVTESHPIEVGEALLKQSRFDEAEQSLKAAMEIYPEHPKGYAGYAMVAHRRKEWDEGGYPLAGAIGGISGKRYRLARVGRRTRQIEKI